MFDGLRSDPSDSSGFDDQPVEYFSDDQPAAAPEARPRPKASAKPRKSTGKLFGLNAQQRFFISLMLMFAVCMLGVMCLFVTERFIIP